MNKHTPGPWKIDNGGGTTYIEDATDISICRVSANNQIANAQLIAAAPDLLEALEKAVNRQGFTNDELIDARKAIAKANGGTCK